jgi:hypothetical protein
MEPSDRLRRPDHAIVMIMEKLLYHYIHPMEALRVLDST